MRMLGLRDPSRPIFFDMLTNWMRARKVDFHTRSLLDPLPRDLDEYDLCVFWLLDPLDNRQPVWVRALHAMHMCEEAGVPVFQPPDKLPNSRKSAFSRLLREAQLPARVARMFPLADAGAPDLHGLPFPVFFRDDDFHSGELLRVNTAEEVRAVVDAIKAIQNPLVAEFIETVGVDGLYRKYRYVVAGDEGVPLHLQITPNWITRGEDRLFTDEAVQAEKDFIASGRNETLHEAARMLGLDFCAFDYTYDRQGGLVIWEANAAPMLHRVRRYKLRDGDSKVDLDYRNVATGAALDAMIRAYHARAR